MVYIFHLTCYFCHLKSCWLKYQPFSEGSENHLKRHGTERVNRVHSNEFFSILLYKKVKPVCLPEERYWYNYFVGENTTVSGYGRVDQVEVKGRDQTSCRLMKANLLVQPSHEETCNRVRYIFKSLF